jgi:hypothetical protein
VLRDNIDLLLMPDQLREARDLNILFEGFLEKEETKREKGFHLGPSTPNTLSQNVVRL